LVSLKERLLRTLEQARARESDLEDLCVDAPADPGGRWGAKDHIAHLSWWRGRNARMIDAMRRGVAPPPPVEDDVQNAEIYATTRHLPVADIKKEAKRSWTAFEEAVKACGDQDMAREHPYAAGSELWEMVPAHAGHTGTHLMWWWLETGDVERAEAAALWAYEVESEAFPDPFKQADATYNLACFYSRAGRAAEALPLLRRSLEAKPALVELARRDPDLDPIRGHAEFRTLLAT
jgi:tetratricopeptide (TPR) repeat protein